VCRGGGAGDWFASKMDETMNNGVLVCMCVGWVVSFISEMDDSRTLIRHASDLSLDFAFLSPLICTCSLFLSIFLRSLSLCELDFLS